jgi:Na+/H+ antiporter NhaD/arsenite permease-like protein
MSDPLAATATAAVADAAHVAHSISNEVASLIVFAVSYALISARQLKFLRLNRPAASVVGAVLMVVATDLTLDEAFLVVNWHTITLLLGMMVIVAYLRMARFFDLAAYYLLHAATDARAMVWLIVFASGLLSALFVNDTICLLLTPIVLLVTVRSRVNPVPFLIAIATGSNVGGVVTMTGNPQNMLVGTQLARLHPEWTFARFTLYMLPVGVVSMAIAAAVICRVYRRDLEGRALAGETLAFPRVNARLIRKCMVVLVLALGGFLLFPRELPLVAVAAAAVLLCWSRRDPHKVFARVDWTLLLFFVALFVIIGGVDRSGIIVEIHALVAPHLRGGPAREVGAFSAVSLVLSQLLSNVPYVFVAGSWVESFERPAVGWLTLAMASTFAGNLTIFGSVANMIVVELAKKEAPIGFWEYCRAGIPITVLTLAVGVAGFWSVHLWLG